jgi:RecB family endonuclease NucS
MRAAPPPTSVRSFVRAKLERQLEDLFWAYPELIEPGLIRHERQSVLSNKSRSDLLFFSGRTLVVVEIKRDVFKEPSVRQLGRYLRTLTRRHDKVRGIAIGSGLDPKAEKLLPKFSMQVVFKALDRDVPLQVVVCLDCRQVRDHRKSQCPKCGSKKIIQ